MIKVKKLKNGKTVMDLELNQHYAGEVRDGMITLNDKIRIKTGDTRKGFFPVKVKKISLPNDVEVEIVNEQFTATEEPDEKVRFFMKSDILKKMEKRFSKAVSLINRAVDGGRLIIVRHHADADGYAGALALEEVLIPRIQKINDKTWQNYKRFPMKAPFYEYGDALRDLSYFRDSIAFGKKPLLIMIDNGSGDEDLLALKRLKMYDVEIIVIDHHVYSEEVDRTVDVHINARTEGAEGDFCAGILCFELARQLGKPRAIYPAFAGVADKSRQEFVEPYMKLARQSKSFLEDLSKCVDFEAYNMRFMDSDTVYDLFNKNQKGMMDLLLPEIKERNEKVRKVLKKYLKTESRGKFKVSTIDFEKTTSFGEYPTLGKVISIAHSMTKGPRVTVGYTNDLVTFRVDNMPFSITKLLKTLRDKLPHGNISGGGHDFAGTVKFVPAVKEEVLSTIKSMVR